MHTHKEMIENIKHRGDTIVQSRLHIKVTLTRV